jgi:chitin disaccharide deacetylase
MLLIVNADDLGTSQSINDEIFGLMNTGLVTSASIITNAPAFEDAAAHIREFPNCSFGVHLNLTVFSPMSSGHGLAPLLDENGRLSRKFSQTAMTAGLRKAILEELIVQVQRAFDAGIPVSHFDSHQHIHTIPKFFLVLKSLQRKFGVRKVRSTISLLPSGQRMTSLRSLRKSFFRLALRHAYATKSPDGLGDFRDFHAALIDGNLQRYRYLELMVHPGTTNPLYKEEIRLLRSGWQSSLPPEVKIGNYHSL